eukprot:3615528-Prymnesium_polylepis.1
MISGAGVFIFFIFFGLSVLLRTLIFEVAVLVHVSRRKGKLSRLRYRGGNFVKMPPVSDEEFKHLPGLQPSTFFHLFLSRELGAPTGCADVSTPLRSDAWPLGQDVCKLIKQRCREICPSMHVFLDVDDLTSDSGSDQVDHSRCILVFAMP